MKISQTAGGSKVEVYTDGSPLWPEVTLSRHGRELEPVQLRIEDLHDLRYCIDRVLAQLPPDRRDG